MLSSILGGFLQICFFLVIDGQSCELPIQWQNKEWWDIRISTTQSRAADRRTFNTGTSTITGMKVIPHSTPISSWTCHLQEDNIYLFKGEGVVDVGGFDKTVYVALEVGNSSDIMSIYYSRNEEESSTSDERIKLLDKNTVVTSVDQVVQLSSRPDSGEYHVLIPRDVEAVVNSFTPVTCEVCDEPDDEDCDGFVEGIRTKRNSCCGGNLKKRDVHDSHLLQRIQKLRRKRWRNYTEKQLLCFLLKFIS